ncbi:MAG: methyltransferase domain-containing protein [Candidatus Sericytochromatia bacterium]|nr:methyltransferase domain-containing protein [Candidatus Sericytochromatia bacterium]
MTTLLFPGRHLVNTRFQESCLLAVLGRTLDGEALLGGPPPRGAVTDVVFAVTSANQSHSRYNPLPFHARALGVDRFGRQLREALGIRYRIVGVPHFNPTERFCAHVLKAIAEETEDDLTLTPTDTVVVCSTPGLIEEWAELGFAVMPAEHAGDTAPPRAERPIELVRRLAELGEDWPQDPALRQALAPAWFSLFLDFPELPRRITRLYRDPLLNDEGSLTETRNYGTYARAMDSIIDLKFQEIRPGLTPGKIVDEGCADGGLLARIAREFPDSDLIGIDIAAEFIARAHERQRAGEFGGTFVHFHQRNLLSPIFRPASIDTTICNSTLHELWSYGDERPTVEAYLAEKFRQTRPGGTLVIRDVVGFADRDRPVWMVCDETDGSNEDPTREIADPEALAVFLGGLSTCARFLRFARDFQAELRAQGRRGPETQVRYEAGAIGGKPAFKVRFQDGIEFLTKVTYVDNWASEMNESFAFWSFDEWKAALHRAGFHVVESSVEPELGSRAYLSAWRVAHDFKDRVRFYGDPAGGVELPLPPTNMVLIGRRP